MEQVFLQSKCKFVSEYGITNYLARAIGWSKDTEVKFYYGADWSNDDHNADVSARYGGTFVGNLNYIGELPECPDDNAYPYGTACRVNGEYRVSIPDELL